MLPLSLCQNTGWGQKGWQSWETPERIGMQCVASTHQILHLVSCSKGEVHADVAWCWWLHHPEWEVLDTALQVIANLTKSIREVDRSVWYWNTKQKAFIFCLIWFANPCWLLTWILSCLWCNVSSECWECGILPWQSLHKLLPFRPNNLDKVWATSSKNRTVCYSQKWTGLCPEKMWIGPFFVIFGSIPHTEKKSDRYSAQLTREM